MTSSSILNLDDPAACDPRQTGGKGASLARMKQAGFPVPPGFVVATGTLGTQAREPVAAEHAGRICSELARYAPGAAFAVRSSSTLEDLDGAAFAGQHDTFLNIRGADEVLHAIAACRDSLWSERAVAYRERHGFDHARASMAVVVQQMVDAEVSGVAFGVNPVTGDLGAISIDANRGLGESVVGGAAAVDHWELDKRTGAVRCAVIAVKRMRIVAAGEGVRTELVDDADAATPSLTAGQLAELADLVRRVEAVCSFPQDIEWCLAGGRFWLVQARPVTRIPPRWTRDESAERFPNVITPLTWDLVDEGFHRSLDVSFAMLGFPKCPGRWFALHDHYVYGDQNLVDLYLRRPGFSPASLDELRAALPGLRARFDWMGELPGRWTRALDTYLLDLGALATRPLDDLPARAIWEHVLAIQTVAVRYFEPNIAISITQASLHRLLGQLTRLVVPDGAEALLERLLWIDDTRTSDVNRGLRDLASMIRGEPGLAALFRAWSGRALAAPGRFDAFPDFAAAWQAFLREHAHREVEFDMYAAPWGEAPWIPLDLLRLLATGPADDDFARRDGDLRIRAVEALHTLLEQVPADLRVFYSQLVRLARLYTVLDDVEHYETMRLTPVFRRALRALGARIQQEAGLADPMDVYFARREQLVAALTAGTGEAMRQLGRHIARQKAAWQEDRRRTPDWELGCAAPDTAAAEGLSGLAGSPGIAEGLVCVVQGPEDFGRFMDGAVLVARTTSPSWTPLFYRAAAVVTESGGPLSHGAVTAREVGIPAVLSVRGAMAAFREGERVRVNGTTARVDRVTVARAA